MLYKMDGGIGGYFLCGIEWLALTFEKKENPQTAILSHLWDCVMVTRTGIEPMIPP